MREDTLPLTLRGKVSPNDGELKLFIQAHRGRLQGSALSHLECPRVATCADAIVRDDGSRRARARAARGANFSSENRRIREQPTRRNFPDNVMRNQAAGATRRAQNAAPGRPVQRVSEEARGRTLSSDERPRPTFHSTTDFGAS